MKPQPREITCVPPRLRLQTGSRSQSRPSIRAVRRAVHRLNRSLALASCTLLWGATFGCGDPGSPDPSPLPPPVSAGPPALETPSEPETDIGHALRSDSGSALASAPAGPDAEPAAARYRGLWVLCEGSRRVLEDPSRIAVLIDDAQALEVTDLFVQVYRGGRAWFASEIADDAPYRAIVDSGAQDPLALLITRAHAAGLRVHAWVNVLSLSRNREAPILKQLGRAAIHVDRRGRSILDYPESLELPEPDTAWYRVGTPGLYLDPAAPGVADRLVATFVELADRYPDLDGLHLDYIRHPGILPFAPGSRFGVGLDYGYGEASRLRFRRETGRAGPYPNGDPLDRSRIVNANRWDAWRRDKVTELVAKIGEATSERHPGLRLSAAVISYLDRAYLSLAQDWRRWLEDGLIDFAVPMIYSKDDRLFRYQVEAFAKGPQAARIWAGVGVWLFDGEPQRARAQLEIAREAGVAGDALFSYDAIYDTRPAAKIATAEATANAAAQPTLFSVLAESGPDGEGS